MKILTKTIYEDGKTYPLCLNLIACKSWSISWHPHVRVCRYGWYRNGNPKLSGGLWMNLNLPILGDFSLWKHWNPK